MRGDQVNLWGWMGPWGRGGGSIGVGSIGIRYVCDQKVCGVGVNSQDGSGVDQVVQGLSSYHPFPCNPLP